MRRGSEIEEDLQMSKQLGFVVVVVAAAVGDIQFSIVCARALRVLVSTLPLSFVAGCGFAQKRFIVFRLPINNRQTIKYHRFQKAICRRISCSDATENFGRQERKHSSTELTPKIRALCRYVCTYILFSESTV